MMSFRTFVGILSLVVFIIHPGLTQAISMEQGKGPQGGNDPIWGSNQKSDIDFPMVARSPAGVRSPSSSSQKGQEESYDEIWDEFTEDFPSPAPGSPGVTKEKLKSALSQINLSKQQKRQVKGIIKQTKEEAKTSGRKGKDPQKIIDQIRAILSVEQRREFDRILSSP